MVSVSLRTKLARSAAHFSAALAIGFLSMQASYAGPQGGQVVRGTGTIVRPNTTTTNVNQTSHRIVVNWDSFNVGANETVNFNQPSSDAAALNRIFDQNPSEIFGSINANGRVLLVNPNGVLFGQSASVNVGSLIASGLDINPDAFMNGDWNFRNADGSTGGVIVNHGLLQAAEGGTISLFGGAVLNTGTIIANYGSVNLAAGEQVTIDFDGDGLIQFAVDGAVLDNALGLDAAVSNSGTIRADSGRVLLSAASANDVFAQVVNNSGVVAANGVATDGGRVFLTGSGGDVFNSGTISATSAAGDGGTVHVLGDRVALTGDATIDVSGATGGGQVRIGGGFKGGEGLQEASHVFVSEDATIAADATENGDGGTVVVWSDEGTRFYGTITGRGAGAGSGGFAEVSGAGLVFRGLVDLGSDTGDFGTLLLDPTDIVIQGGSGDGDDGGTGSGTLSDPTILFADTPTTFTVYESELEAASADIILQATNSITTAGTFDGNIELDNSIDLTLETSDNNGAGIDISDVTFETSVTAGITIIAGSDVGGGTASISVGGLITGDRTAGNSSSISLTADGDITLNSAIRTGNVSDNSDRSSGNITITSGGNVTSLAGATIQTGDVTSSGGNSATSGDITITAGGNIDLDADVMTGAASSGSDDATSGDVTLSATGVVSGDGLVSTGTASVTAGNNAGDTARAGDITLSGAEISRDGTAAFAVAIGTTTVGGTGSMTSGSLSATATGSGANGEIRLTSASDLHIASLNTADADTTAVDVTVTGGNLLAIDGGATLTLDQDDVTLTADEMTIGANVSTTGAVTLTAATAGRSIDLGSTATSADTTLELSDAELDFIDGASVLRIGDAGVNAINISQVIDTAGVSTLHLTSGGNITQTAAIIEADLAVTSDGTVTLNNASNDVTRLAGVINGAGSFSFRDTNAIVLDAVDGLTGVSSGAGGITLHAGTTLDDAGDATDYAVTTGTLTLQSAGVIGGANAEGLNISAASVDATLGTGGNDITLTDSGASATSYSIDTGGAGTITITQDANTLDVADLVTGGNAVLVAGTGSITQSGAMTVTGTGSFTTSGTDQTITLDDTGNAINGAVTFNTTGAAGHATFNNGTTAVDLGASTVGGNLAVATDNTITDSGATTVAGTATFAAGAANNITLDGDGVTASDFTTLLVTSGNDVTIADANDLDLGASAISGDLDIAASGIITDSGALTVAGTATFDAGGTVSGTNDVVLDEAGDFNTVVVTQAGDVALTDSNGIDIGASTISGDLAVTSAGAISDSGAISVGGDLALDAGGNVSGANDITLDDANTFGGAISVAQAGDVVLVDGGDVDLGDIVANNLDVTGAGTITDSGVVNVSGTTVLDAGGTATGTNDITLDGNGVTAADLGSIEIVQAGHVTLADSDDLAFGASTISGNLDVTAGGAISQTDALTVAGNADFTVSVSDEDITLADAGNDIDGTITFTTQGTAANVTYSNNDAATLGASSVAGDLSVTATGLLSVTGDVTADGQANITGAGVTNNATITGNTGVTINAGAGTFTNASDAVNRGIISNGGSAAAITIIADGADLQTGGVAGDSQINGGTGTVTIQPFTNGTALNLGSATGALDISSAEAQTVTAATLALGDATDTGAVTLDQFDAGNLDVAITGASIDDVDDAATHLATTGDVSLTATAGAIGASGVGLVVDAASVSATTANQDITLAAIDFDEDGTNATAANLAVGAAGITSGGGNVTLNVADDVTLGGEINAGAGTVTIAAGATALDNATVDNVASVNGAAPITGSAIDIDAVSGIGNAIALNTASTSIVANTTAGALDIDNTSATDATVTLGSGDAAVTFDQSGGGDLLLGAVTAATTATLTSTAGINDDSADPDTTTDVTAATVSLTAATGIGNSADVDLSATSIAASSTAGAIALNNAATAATTVTNLSTDGANITFAQTGGQTLDIEAATTTTSGDITIGNDNAELTAGSGAGIASAGDVHLATTTAGNIVLAGVSGTTVTATSSGNINDGAAAAPVVNATDLALDAQAGIIALDIDAATVAATTASGNIEITDANDLAIGTVGALSGVTISAGAVGDDIAITTGGALTATGNASDDIDNQFGDITLAAGTTIGAAGTPVLVELDTANGVLNLDAGGDIDVASTSSIALGSLATSAGAHDVSISVTSTNATIELTQDIDAAVTTGLSGDNLNFSIAGTTLPTAPINDSTFDNNGFTIDVDNGTLAITADTINLAGTVQATGGISVAAADEGSTIGLGDIVSSAAVAGQNFVLTDATINTLLNASGGALTIGSATSGDVIIDGVDISGISNGSLSIVTGGTISDDDADTNGNLGFTGGADDTLRLTSNGAIGLADGLSVNTGTIDVTSSGGNAIDLDIFTDLASVTVSAVTGGAGSIDITQDNLTAGVRDLALQNIATAGAVTITNNTGSLTEAGSDGGVDVAGGSVTLTATGGIGASNGIETSTSTLTADSGNNGIILNNSFATGTVTADLAVASSGSISYFQTGGAALDITASTAAGALSLNSTADITVTSATAGAVASDNSDISVNGGADVFIGFIDSTGDDVIVTASGAIEESAPDAGADVLGASIDFNAASGIGAADAIETASAHVDALNSGTGNIHIVNDGAGGTYTTAVLENENGNISFRDIGNHLLVLSAVTSTSGDITLVSDPTFDLGLANVDAAGSVIAVAGENFVFEEVRAGNTIDVTAAVEIFEADLPGTTDVVDAGVADLIAGTVNLTVTGGDGNISAEIDAANVSAQVTGAVPGSIQIENYRSDTGATTVTNLSLAGDGNIGYVQTGGADVEFQNVTTTNGAISLANDGGNLTATSVTANGAGADVALSTTTSGTISLGSVAATDQVSINAVEDVIESANDTTTNITAANVSINAQTGIGTTANGAIDINAPVISNLVTNTGGIAVLGTGQASINFANVDTTDGDITLTVANGHLDATDVVAGGTGDVVLATTGSGNVRLGQVTATGNDVTINSAAAITDLQNDALADIAAASATLNAVSGIGAVGNSVDLSVATVDSASTGVGGINLNSLASTTFASVATTGAASDITLTGTGNTTVTSATTNDGSISVAVTSGDLSAGTVTAGGTARDIDLTTTTGGDITLGSITAAGDTVTVTSASAIDDDAGGTDTVADVTAATVSLSAIDGIGDTDRVEVDAANLSAGNTTSNDVVVGVLGSITLSGAITNSAAGGALDITAIDGDLDTGAGLLSTNNGAITLTATDDGNGGNLTVGTGGINTTGAAGVTLNAADDIVLNGNVAGGTITANAGDNTFETAADNAGSINGAGVLSAGSIDLLAATGIGNVATLNLDADILTANVSATGEIDIADSDGVQLGDAGAGVSTADGDITITVAGLITSGNSIDAGAANAVTISTTGDRISLSHAVTSQGGDIVLASGNGTLATAGVSTTGTGDITLTADDAGNAAAVVVGGGVSTGSGLITIAAADTVSIAAAVTTTGDVSITANDTARDPAADSVGEIFGGGLVSGDTVTLRSTRGISLNTSATTIDALNNGLGDIVITEANDVAIAQLVAANGAVSLNASGNITDTATATISATGNASFTGDSITLGDTGTDSFNAGTLTFNSTGAVSISENSAMSLSGASTADSLALTSAASIGNTASLDLEVANNASFTSTGGQISLGNVAGDNVQVGSVTLNTSVASLASFAEDDDTVMAGASSAGNLAITSAGSLTDNAGATVTSASTAQLNAGTGGILLDEDHDFANLNFNTTGDVEINDVNAVNLVSNNTADNLQLVAGGAITDAVNASLVVASNADFSGTSITLGDSGADTFNAGTLTFASAGAVSISENSATVLSGTNSAGSLALTSSGTISDAASTTLAVTGNANLTAELLGVAQDITLGNDDAIDFGSLTFTGADVAIAEDSATVLSGVSTATSLDLDANGAISDDNSADLTVTGNASFADAGGAGITLDDAYSFGSVTFNSTGAVAITEGNDTQIAGSNSAGSLVLTSVGAITDAAGIVLDVTGNASFTANNGGVAEDITLGNDDTLTFGSLTFDGAAVSITEDNATQLSGASSATQLSLVSNAAITNAAGASLVVADGGAGNAAFEGTSIDLGVANAGTFNFDTLTFNSSGAVAIHESSDTLLLGTLTADSLALDADGGISDSGDISLAVTGNASFAAADTINIGGSTGDIVNFGTLTVNLDSGINPADAIIYADGDVVFSGTSAITNGNLGIVSQTGDILDDGSANLTVSGSAAFIATGGGDIVLDDTYAFGTLGFNTTGGVTIVEADATLLTDDWGGSIEAGSLSLTSGGSIVDAADTTIFVTGNASFTASGGTDDIVLGDDTNDATTFGTLTFNGATVDVTHDGAIVLANSSTADTLNLTANGGGISDTGDITVTGTATLIAAGSSIQLDSATNNFDTVVIDDGVLGADAVNVTIRDEDGIVLGAATISGAYDVTATSIDVAGAVSANTVDFDVSAGAGDITDSGAGSLTVAGTSLFSVDGGDVLLDAATNDFDSNDSGDAVTVAGTAGTVTLTDEDAIRLGAIATGALNVTAGGNVTQAAALDVSGATAIDAAGFNVLLNNAGNTFTGAISVDALGATLVNDTATILGASNIGANGLSVTSTAGNITDSGVLSVSGATTLAAGTNDITLDNGNDFSSVTVSSADDVTLNDTNALTLTSITATGAVSATAGGLLAATNVTTSGGTDADDITLQGASVSLATVDADGLGDVSVTATTGAITDNASAVSGDVVSLSANTSVGANGAEIHTAAGTLNVTATNNDAFVVETGGDVLIGTVNVNGTFDLNVQSGSIQDDLDDTVTDITAGTAILTASGDIGGDFGAPGAPAGTTDTREALEINAGTLTLNADNVTVTDNGTAAVTLSFAGDSFDYETANDILVGLITATNDVTLISTGGSINDSAANNNLTVDIDAGGDVALTAFGEIGGTAHLDISSASLSANVTNAGDIVLNDFGGTTLANITTANGSITVDGDASLELGTVSASGTVTIDSADALTDTNGDSDIGGTTVTLTAVNGIGSAGNAINTAATTLDLQTTANSIVINEADGVNLAGVDAPTFTLTANGAVTDSGTIAVTGVTTLDAGTNDITLDTLTNDFDSIVITDGNNVTLTDANDLELGASTIGGDLALTVIAGGLTQSGAIDVGGTTDINATGQTVTLANVGNTFTGAITIDALGAVIVNDTATAFGASTIGANGLTVASESGDVTQSGAIDVAGAIDINAAGQDVTLANAGNTFTGTITIDALGAAITNDAATDLGASNIGANGLVITSEAGDVTQSGTLEIAGTTDINAAGQTVTLADTGNTFTGAFTIDAVGASIVNDTATVFGASTIGAGGLTVTSESGDVTQSGALDVAGTTDINASGRTVTLTNTGNTFTGAITVDALGAALTNDTATNLGASDIGTGGLTVNSASGAVTQSGLLDVDGDTAINAAGQAVTLTLANDFTGSVSGAGTTFSLTDTNAIELGDITATALNVTANGAITDDGTGNLDVSGTTTLAAGAANDITLDVGTNDFGTVVVTSGNNVTLVDTNGIDIGAMTIAGDLDVAADGTLTTSGNVTAGGDVSLAANGAGSNISMTDGDVISAAGNVSLAADTNVALSRITSGGTVDVTATNGDITDNLTGEGAGNENVVGTTVTFNAATGIGTYAAGGSHAGDIDINAVELTAVLSSDGDIGIFETDSIYLNTVDAGLTTGNSVIIEAAGNIDDHDDDQVADITADIGELIAGGTIGGNPQVLGGDLSLDLDVTNLTLSAGGATDVLDVGVGTVTLSFSSNQDFVYQSLNRNIEIGIIDVRGVDDRDVTITTTNGWIRDDADGATTDIHAGGVITLSAGAGIGDAGRTLTFDAPTMSLHAGNDISVISDSTGAVTVTNLASDTGAIAFQQVNTNDLAINNISAVGAVDIDNANGTLTTGTIDTAGNVDLDAAGIVINGATDVGGAFSADSTDSLAINGAVDAGTTIDLDAGDTLDINAAITAGGVVTIDSINTTTLAGGGSINAGGAVSFGGTDGGALDLGGDIVTSGDAVTFNNAVNLTGTSNIDTNNGAVVFQDTVDGGETLTVDAGTGSVDFNAEIGGAVALASLDVTGGAVTFGNDVTTTGAIDITNSGVLTLAGAAINAGTTFTQGGAGTASIGSNITSDGDITFGGAVTLTGDVMFDTTGSFDIAFQSGVTGGGNDLALDAAGGIVQFGGVSTGLGALTVTAATADVNADIGAASFDFSNNVDLAANADLIAGAGAVDIGGSLTLGSSGTNVITSNGDQDILIGNINGTGAGLALNAAGDIDVGIVNLGGGSANFTVDSAAASAGAVLHADSITAGAVTLSSGNGADDILDVADIDASGAVNLASAFQLGANTSIDAGSFTAAGTLSGARNLTVDSSGDVTFAAINGLTGIDIVDANNVTFNAAVNVGTGGLDVANGGTWTVNGDITSNGAVIQGGAGVTNLNADIVTSGDAVAFASAVDFTGNRSIDTGTGTTGAITIGDGISGAGGNLALSAGGAAITLGDASGIGTLDLNATGSFTLAGDVSVGTFDNAGLTGVMFVSGSASITASNTDIDLGNAASIQAAGGGGSLSVDAGSANVQLAATGTTSALSGLSVSGSTIDLAEVNTTGGQSYDGNVSVSDDMTATSGVIDVDGNMTLAGNATLSGDAIAISGTIDGARELTLDASGAVSVGGAIGATSAVSRLTIDSATASVQTVTTSGAQTYNSDLAVNGDMTGGSLTFNESVNFVNGGIVTSDTINFHGGASSVTGGGELTLVPFTDGADVDLGGNSGVLNLDIAALNGYDAGLVIGGIITPTPLSITTIADRVSVNGDLDVGDGYLTIISRSGISLGAGELSGDTITLVAADQFGTISNDAEQVRDSLIRSDNVILVAGGEIGGAGGNEINVIRLSGQATLEVASGAQDAYVNNIGNSLLASRESPRAVAIARAIGIRFGNTTITNSAQNSANREQSGGLVDEGFIDPSLFEDISLYEISGTGIALPADQSEEEIFDEGPATDCNLDEEDCDLEGAGAIGAISPR